MANPNRLNAITGQPLAELHFVLGVVLLNNNGKLQTHILQSAPTIR